MNVVPLGWQVIDLGPAPLSPVLDEVPDTDDPVLQLQWRRRAETDGARLHREHDGQPTWYPVGPTPTEYFVPFFGGRGEAWGAAVATLTAGLVRNDYARVRVVDLTNRAALSTLHTLSRHPRTPWGTIVHRVSGRGATLEMLSSGDAEELTTVLADALEAVDGGASGFDVASIKQALLIVAQRLRGPVEIGRLRDAVHLALTQIQPSTGGFSPDEHAALVRLHGEVKQRPELQRDLDRLERSLTTLARFARRSGDPEQIGPKPARVRTIELVGTGSRHELVIAQQIVGHHVARQFEIPSARSDALILIGGNLIPDHLLRPMISVAYRDRKQLVVFFEHLDDRARDYLGANGSQWAVFFALPNIDDAERAARHIGHEYKFVVNGRSVSESESEQWSDTHTESADDSTSRALNFGQSFGRSLTRGSSRGRSDAVGRGGGRDRSWQTSENRVHEFVVEPEELQRLPDTTMLVLAGKTAILADCNPRIRTRRLTASTPYPVAP